MMQSNLRIGSGLAPRISCGPWPVHSLQLRLGLFVRRPVAIQREGLLIIARGRVIIRVRGFEVEIGHRGWRWTRVATDEVPIDCWLSFLIKLLFQHRSSSALGIIVPVRAKWVTS